MKERLDVILVRQGYAQSREKAKALLESGASLSIGEIAERVGYEDAYHFSKLFKKTYGVSPSKMRKEV